MSKLTTMARSWGHFMGRVTASLSMCAALSTAMAAETAAAEGATFLDAEQAFKMSAQIQNQQGQQGQPGERAVSVQFTVADGYYLYKNKVKVSADAGVELGEIQFPPALRKVDPQFGETEVYRGTVSFTVPVKQAAQPFTLKVKAQGCADAGLCYPPFMRTASLDGIAPPAAGSLAEASRDAAPAGGNAIEADESSRIGSLLEGHSWPLVLVTFLGFGLLLAFTPCVFPMIPILSGIIVGQGAEITKRRALTLSLGYVLGMAITYTAAGVAAGLSGTLLSAALQNPWALGGFAVIFVVLSLSMFGFYDLQLPASLQSRLSASANNQKGSLLGVSLMGALSALIVGPCVAAPLAGALLYIAKTGDAVLGGAALFAMALGMGVPLVAVGVAAGSFLPRAGAWMEGVKKAFGVMLLAVAIWLVSPVAPSWLVMLAWAALLIFCAIYLHAFDSLPPEASGARRFWKGVGVMAGLAGAAMFVGALGGSRDPLQPLAWMRGGEAQAQPARTELAFTKVKTVAELQTALARADRSVMVDFYADWCVSCKEMEHLTFADPAVRDRLQRMHLIQLDVTQNTADDQALLKRFNLFGPPSMVFFPAKGGQELTRVVGFQPADAFVKVLDSVLARAL